MRSRALTGVALAIALISARAARAAEPAPDTGEAGGGEAGDAAELARATQNPVADLISVPFQNNTDYNIGRFDRARNTLNIQPVIPMHVTQDWMVVTRVIAPVIYQPDIENPGGGTSGLGDINPTFFLSPAKPGKFIWGFGPVFQLPTATQRTTGTGKWCMGPSAVGLMQTDKWTVGALVNNIWSFAGPDDRVSVNQFLLQYFVNYNLPEAWYLTSSPILTADWESGDWIVPFGAGVGKIFHLGKLPLNGQVSGYYNAIRPDTPPSPSWQMRLQVAFLFPTGKPKGATAGATAAATTRPAPLPASAPAASPAPVARGF